MIGIKDPIVTCLVLDTAPFLKCSDISGLAEEYYTIPEVIAEIKDEESRGYLARSNIPLKIKQPSNESFKAVIEFSKKTGDFPVLSRTDLKVLALVHTLETEKNGNSFLRIEPRSAMTNLNKKSKRNTKKKSVMENETSLVAEQIKNLVISNEESSHYKYEEEIIEISEILDNSIHTNDNNSLNTVSLTDSKEAPSADEDEEGWITPKNISKIKKEDIKQTSPDLKSSQSSYSGCMTSDFAMQNVLLQMNLKLISLDGIAVKQLKTYVLRCHACYKTTKDMDKRFCPSCGNNTLIRTSVGTDADGNVIYYLKKNFQYNLRGTKYSIPTSKGGKKNKDLILCEDQKEFQNALRMSRPKKNALDLFDPDYMPLDSLSKSNSSMMGPIIGHGRKNPNEARKNRK